VSIVSASESPEAAAEQPVEGRPTRPPTRELLPHGLSAALVIVGSIFLLSLSLADFGFSGRGLLGVVFCPVMLVLGAIDLRHHLLPNDIVAPAVVVVGIIAVATTPGDFVKHLAVGTAIGLFFFSFALVFAGSLGMGDAKVGFLLGLALGSRALPALMVAMAGLLLAALWILATQGVTARKKSIPFGPFLALGGILAFFLG
jgi:leader peptidase (prepilin peptidase)/N-methyltransferase